MKYLRFARYAFITAAACVFAASSDAAWTYTETNSLANINNTCIPKELYNGKVGIGYITDDNWKFHAFRSIDKNSQDIYVDASRWEEIKVEKAAPIDFSEINEGFKVVYFSGVKANTSLIKKYATELVAPDCSYLAGENSFLGSEVLTNVTLCATEAVSLRNDRLFQSCQKLVSFTPKKIADNILRTEMFNGCSSLEGEFEFPECTQFNKNVFNGCAKLGGIKAEKAVVIGQSSFAGCSSLSNIVLSSSVSTVGNYAFSGCSKITTEFVQGILHKGLTRLGNAATDRKGCFSGCTGLVGSLVWDLPNLITNAVPDSCFDGCTSLERVEIKTPVSVIGNSAFNELKPGAEIYFPDNSIESYGSFAVATKVAPFPKVYISEDYMDAWFERMMATKSNHLMKKEDFTNTSWVSSNGKKYNEIKRFLSEDDSTRTKEYRNIRALLMSDNKACCWILKNPETGFMVIVR